MPGNQATSGKTAGRQSLRSKPLNQYSVDLERARAFTGAAQAPATRRAYASDFAIFSAWCAERALKPLPAAPVSVSAFLASQAHAGARPSTIGRRMAAIRHAHKRAGHPSPTDDPAVKATMAGIRRSWRGTLAKKVPAISERLIAMAETGEGLRAARDRALLLLGFAGAFRRSELVALGLEDIEETADGLLITIRRSKTDPEGEGTTIGILPGALACPIAALRAWLGAAAITSGPVFRSVRKGGTLGGRLCDRSVANIVKAHAARAGLDAQKFAGHSLRSGFLTSAAARGASAHKMKDVSRHRRIESLAGYIREAEIFKDHAGAGLL